MFSDINVKIIILLLCLSIAAFISHRSGLMDTSFPILIKTNEENKKLFSSSGMLTQLTKSDGLAFKCELISLKNHHFCGVSITLGHDGGEYGLDLREFNRLAATIKYTAPTEAAKLKIAFRNYNARYSNLQDNMSLKINSISYTPSLHNKMVVIPLGALQVDSWWVEKYQVGFDNRQVELSNVPNFEIITDGMNAIGDYHIDIESAVLHGKLISETNLLKCILLLWLMAIIFLVTLQRNKLKHMSMTDPLTGLYNCRGIRSWINKTTSSRINKYKCHMFYLGLDDFKKVNDTYGHLVGDQLLIGFSKSIQRYLNSIPHVSFAFSRLSGDEFMIIILDIEEDEIKHFAKSLLAVLDKPIVLKEHEMYVRASLGTATLKLDVNTFEDLLARADAAMSYAKKEGKNQYKIFDDTVAQDIFFRKKTAEKVKNAITNDNFYLNFMPIFDAKSLDVVRVEVLLRTNSPVLKDLGPEIFIPIAEEYNLIKDIDLWVIEATFKQIIVEKTFLERFPFIFCINISAVELHNPLFVPQLKALLSLYKIAPNLIELEVTETSFVETDLMSISTLTDIRALGIKLALDDFGTGYTAFSQLINYPVDYLKIDKSFIDNFDSADNTQATMIKAIVSIAESYQLKTIGEGVEERQQYAFLVEQGCHMIQGHLFSKPMIWDELTLFLSDPQHKESRRLKVMG